jgi:hypothetical protein
MDNQMTGRSLRQTAKRSSEKEHIKKFRAPEQLQTLQCGMCHELGLLDKTFRSVLYICYELSSYSCA